MNAARRAIRLAAGNGQSDRTLAAADIAFITTQARPPDTLAAGKVDEPNRRSAVRWLAEQERPQP